MSFERLNKAMTKNAKNLEKNYSDLFRAVVLQSLTNCVLSTPVDTGNARGSWQVSTSVSGITVNGKEDSAGAATILAGTEVLDKNKNPS